uniref:Uncharacterized protein n=1 Tax=Rhizophora mucronata TaxID=61149 RepID=A0A2P2N132_RHIMU
MILSYTFFQWMEWQVPFNMLCTSFLSFCAMLIIVVVV